MVIYKKILNTKEKSIQFHVNGGLCTVEPGSVPATLSLARYLRDYLELTGTKVSCNQSGCGACTVTAEIPDPNETSNSRTKSVNSCITPVLICNGWFITTVEGLGNIKEGMHPIQERLSQFHGTQCGFCTPGMVMQMNSYMASQPQDPNAQDIEDILDGNICRCTGYRPILDAFKSFADDKSKELQDKLSGLPSSAQKTCPITQQKCVGHNVCKKGVKRQGSVLATASKFGEHKNEPIPSQSTSEGNWLFPHTLDELMEILKNLSDDNTYRMVAGNTGTGVYDHDTLYDTYIDISKIPELAFQQMSPSLELGGGTTLHDLLEIMERLAEEQPSSYKYGKQFGIHLRKVAHTGVRHNGTIAGNLMLKHAHHWFPSDVFALLEGSGAQIVTQSASDSNQKQQEQIYTPSQWLKTSMHKKVVLKILFPKLDPEEYTFCSYKITPRRTNAHAYVNSAMKICTSKDFIVSERPSIVYGGITDTFVHAQKTEDYLFGKCLQDQDVLQGAMLTLDEEISPWDDPSEASTVYRKQLTKSLLYKTFLSVLGDAVSDPKLISASQRELPRGVSKGSQSFPSFEDEWPLYQPIRKLESKSQCTGEAEYIGDISKFKGEVHAAYVITEQGVGELDNIDPSEALNMPGVVGFVDHNDIPGENNIQAFAMFGATAPKKELFSSGKITHVGQVIGALCADTPEQANRAAKAVKITYKNLQRPIVDMKEAMEHPERVMNMDALGFGEHIGDIDEQEKASDKVFEGEFEIGSQYHNYMETHTHVIRPIENGEFEVYPATQMPHTIHVFLSGVLKIPANKFDVKVRRLGGAYGGKFSHSIHANAVIAVCANKFNRPVKMVMEMKMNMETYGKRCPYFVKWKAGVTNDSKLTFVDTSIYADAGDDPMESGVTEAVHFAQNAYNANAWSVKPYIVITDCMWNTPCRAPGSTQAHNAMEMVMERLAYELNMDPLEFRTKNFLKKGDRMVKGFVPRMIKDNPLPAMIETLKQSSKYLERKVELEQFNQSNKWIKRGISVVPCKYYCGLVSDFNFPCPVLISIYENDGSIAVTHGGIEMGQGMNTKVAQVVASTLGLPNVDLISIKPLDTVTSANGMLTGGSLGSELYCNAAMLAAKVLKARLDEIEKTMEKPPTWAELVKYAYSKDVDLTARYAGSPRKDDLLSYHVWGTVITEVEIDMLTGEKNIRRTDIIEDTGSSLSPEIDIGQIEGAFVMGLGLWTSEQIKFDSNTGKILTFDSWTYKPPMYQDIPEELNVTLYQNDRNEGRGVLGSKATGEPAVHMGVSVGLAIRNALEYVQGEISQQEKEWIQLDAPATVEKIQLTSGVTAAHFIL